MSKYHQGTFRPNNPEKYKGNAQMIIYRSGWELRVMMYLDRDPRVVQWSSEEVVIPYVSPLDNKRHRYFMDFWVKLKNSDGSMQEALIEVKPQSQTVAPKPLNKGQKPTKKFLREVATWGVNQAKWQAARNYCEQRGMKFIIMDEYTLGLKKRNG